MDFLNSSTDLTRIVFLIGAVLALMCKKWFGITPGGIIVPGVLACVLFSSFVAFAIILATSLLCWLIYKYFLSNFALSNHWTSLLMISISVFLSLAELAAIKRFNILNQETMLLSMIIPGLVAISAKKYGLSRVLAAMSATTALSFVSGVVILAVVPYYSLSYFSVRLGEFTPLTLANPQLSLTASLLMALIIYHRFGIRSGGYMIAPFLAAVLYVAPIEFILLAIGVMLSYFTVQFIQRRTLIVGLERFVISLFCGYFVVSAIDLIAITVGINDYHPAPLVLIIAIAVLTNDLCLQPIKATLAKGFSPALLASFVARLAA